jgi:hypothetical protein
MLAVVVPLNVATAYIPVSFCYQWWLHLWPLLTNALLLVYHCDTLSTLCIPIERNLMGLGQASEQTKPPIHFFTMEVEASDTLPFLDILVMRRGPKLTRKVYQKPTHTGCYLHFKSNHPQYVKRGVVHSSVNLAKVIYQNHKDFNNKIKNIRHDLVLSEHQKEFVDSVMKPSTSNHPSSDTTYLGTDIISYVKGTSKKFRRIRNHFNLRTIFKIKHTLHGTLMKTGPVKRCQADEAVCVQHPMQLRQMLHW